MPEVGNLEGIYRTSSTIKSHYSDGSLLTEQEIKQRGVLVKTEDYAESPRTSILLVK